MQFYYYPNYIICYKRLFLVKPSVWSDRLEDAARYTHTQACTIVNNYHYRMRKNIQIKKTFSTGAIL